jgi:hypothetical protein
MTMRITQSGLRLARVAIAALLCLALLGAFAGGASAATYHAFLCRVPYGPNAGKPAPTDGTTYAPNGAFTFAGQGCAAGGAMFAAIGGTAPHAANTTATAAFTTPAGLTINAFTVWRHDRTDDGVDFATPVTNIAYEGAPSVEGQCALRMGCPGHGTATAPLAAENRVVVANLSGVHHFLWTAGCGGDPAVASCPATGNEFSALNEIFAADVLLVDATPPAVTSPAGPLVAGGTLTGTQSVSLNATDAGSGVHKGSLAVDGAVVSAEVLDANGGACADLGVAPDARPSYVNTQPCPAAVSGLLTLDTDGLAPGAHTLTVLISDAAGNETVASTTTITVRGALPANTPNGAGASRTAKLTARHATTRKSARHLAFKTAPTITGRLVDETGKAISGAALTVLLRERRTGAPNAPVATATTGADGSFRLRLPAGPSRTITVQYTAFSGDPTPAVTVKLTTRVRASLTASVSPRSPRARQRLRISGRLRYLRRRGVVISIQARDGRKWRTVDTVETTRNGRYSWPYRFSARSGGHTFAFRARVKSPNYPFEPGTSKAVTVRVR